MPDKTNKIRNPHFDDELFEWKDEYSGHYDPVQYNEQFDYQWRLFLEKKTGFHEHTGVETSDEWIDDRIYEITGVKGFIESQNKHNLLYRFKKTLNNALQKNRDVGGRLFLEPKFPIDFFKGKYCLDVGCGAGRWTKTLLVLGAKVKSVDVSEHGIESTKRFNSDVEYLNLFNIKDNRPDLHSKFNFTICWGVVMCTHDPKLAFENVSKTVKNGGKLYTMIYAPTYHTSPEVIAHRKFFHKSLHTMEEKLEYVYKIADSPQNAINYLDMLNTFYNWTVSEDVIHNWYKKNGYKDVITLNANEPHKCAYHILGTKE